MHTSKRGLSFLLAACLLSGYSTTWRSAAAAPATQPSATKPFVMQHGGANVLRVTAPFDAKCAAADGSLRFAAKQFEMQIWLVRDARTVDEATAKVAGQIVDEFKDFKADRTTDLTIAGSPAKRLVGAGHEADDGDAGAADLIVFKVGDHVFVACTHGEALTPAGQQGLLAVTQTAKLP